MKRALMVMVLLGAAGYTTYRVVHRPAVAVDDGRLALDRIWIDHMPVSETDTIQVFLALSEEPFGVFQQASMWRGAHELFQYEGSGSTLRIVYPQTGEKEKVKVSARECDERGMDYCLEVKGASRGVKRYYSMEGWEVGHVKSLADVQPRIDALLKPVN